MNGTLPTGRLGTALAAGLLGASLLAVWFAAAVPLIAWHSDAAAVLAGRRALAGRMGALAEMLPALQSSMTTGAIGSVAPLLLEGATDAVAAAGLQGTVRDMAGRVGATFFSVETLPAVPTGAYRRIGLRLSLTVPWPVMVRLMQVMKDERPRMVIDDLELHNAQLPTETGELLLNAVFTVYAFRGGTEARGAQ